MSDEKWVKRLEREREARKAAEQLLEQKSAELYDVNQDLLALNDQLESLVDQKTRQLQQLNASLEERVEAVVAELEEKNRVLLQQSRMAAMGEMIGNIAHQWRQPLTAINANIANVELAYALGNLDEKELQESTTTIQELTQYLSTTIDDFANFFKPNRDKEAFSVPSLIDSALRIVESKLKSNHTLLSVDSTLETITAHGHFSELQQVLINIITNANDVLASSKTDDPNIHIVTRLQEGKIHISISDNAGGIPDTIIHKIFDPYFTTKHKSQGTGIGLYMSKVIVEEHHGGQLSAVNIPGGAAFTITLPLVA
jgi:C4-dicarboxylate-specific signal transduction histidine kinase